jgi:hypothetical protein
MSTETVCAGSVYTVAPGAPVELFPSLVERVFNRLACIAEDGELYEEGELHPTKETIEWARRVLLRVLPSYYLRTAEIDVFHGEIHVSWERNNKRVVAFMPKPDVLKLYVERTKEGGEVVHSLRSLEETREINDALKWLFS